MGESSKGIEGRVRYVLLIKNSESQESLETTQRLYGYFDALRIAGLVKNIQPSGIDVIDFFTARNEVTERIFAEDSHVLRRYAELSEGDPEKPIHLIRVEVTEEMTDDILTEVMSNFEDWKYERYSIGWNKGDGGLGGL